MSIRASCGTARSYTTLPTGSTRTVGGRPPKNMPHTPCRGGGRREGRSHRLTPSNTDQQSDRVEIGEDRFVGSALWLLFRSVFLCIPSVANVRSPHAEHHRCLLDVPGGVLSVGLQLQRSGGHVLQH